MQHGFAMRGKAMYRIMIVEDEPKIADMLAAHLRKYGYEPLVAQFFHDLKNEFLQLRPHLVLLDINLPYYDGFYWCRQIRTVSNVPIIYVSARAGEMDQVMAIENGGDDYLTKPFYPEELAARVEVLLRRYGLDAAQPIPLQHLDVFLQEGRVVDRETGEEVRLTGKEFQLLSCFLRHPNQVLTREQLYEAVWGEPFVGADNTLMVHIRHLREKLERDPGNPAIIQTIRGLGYRLKK